MKTKTIEGGRRRKLVTPRPLAADERPRQGISEVGRQRRLEMLERKDQVLAALKEADDRGAFARIWQARPGEQWLERIDDARAEGRMPTMGELLSLHRQSAWHLVDVPGIGIPGPPDGDPPEGPKAPWPPVKDPIMELLEQGISVELRPLNPPDLDWISPTTVSPGGELTLRGTHFGDEPGAVRFEIASDQVIDLEVLHWSETLVRARLDPELSGVRPRWCRVWVTTSDRGASNAMDVRFEPLVQRHVAVWGRLVEGGWFGYPDDYSVTEIALPGATLADPDFEIFSVLHFHDGQGGSELRAPHAGGQSLEQGYHIGVPAFRTGLIQIAYWVRGPRGIAPPYFEALGPWADRGLEQ